MAVGLKLILVAALCLAAATSANAQPTRRDIPAPKIPPGAITLKAPAPPADAPAETWTVSSSDNVPVVQNVTVPTLQWPADLLAWMRARGLLAAAK